LTPLYENYTDEKYRHDLARSHINRGVLYKRKGPDSFDKAEREYRKAIELLRPQNNREAKAALLIDLEVARQNLGNLLLQQGMTDAALKLLSEARSELEVLVRNFPKRLSYQKKLAMTFNSLGAALGRDKKWNAAQDDLKRAREILARLLNEEPDQSL